ncbi:sodium-coupled monocarboxylate transporter 1-like [Anopheles ziemanni]|uniref:sodium-coupled monocarboxylate transporter 1-like n=1 Tax=Anopheles coustani TaxID=139045 RepID=UPI00265987B8|nr:sodium-coupled monocarboxylate transporter 1-like [Anopheles coustani]XP_058173519.1 sodium-coupled monocarboxylate transporter 1-like [Anopheles ziemanni]
MWGRNSSGFRWCDLYRDQLQDEQQQEDSTVSDTTNDAWNYVVFVLFVVISALIPIRKRLFRRSTNSKSKQDYVFGAGHISTLAMMLSIARGTLGVISVLGYPSEFFYRGSAMWESLYGVITAYPIVCFVFIPVYFDLGITSVYQYLELRFNSRLVRCLASGTYIVRTLLSLGVTIYTPTVALNTIIGVPYWVSLLSITVISIFFNALGGLKAAVAADVIQSLSMTAMLVGIIIYCSITVGGVDKIFAISSENDRFAFFNFATDLHLRVTTTSAWLGELFNSLSLLGCQQNFVQRYLSMPTFGQIRRTLMLNIPVVILLFSLPWFVGMAIYAIYYHCDPLRASVIEKMDEILPYFMMDRFKRVPGVWGIFVGTLFNGALTLNISNINSLATVTWEDFLSLIPALKRKSETHQLNVIKLVGTVYAILIMGVGFIVGLLSGVIESSMLIISATSGPLLGVFILAMFIPFANWKGAVMGMVVSHLSILWIAVGRLIESSISDALLDTSIEGCYADLLLAEATAAASNNTSLVSIAMEESVNAAETSDLLTRIYSITYMYYGVFGTVLTVLSGIVFSLATWSSQDAYNMKMLHPAVRWLYARSPFSGKRFGSFEVSSDNFNASRKKVVPKC